VTAHRDHGRPGGAVRRSVRRRRPAVAVTTVLLSLAACAPEGVRDSTTDAAAPEAAAIDGLFWFSVILGTVVWLVVLGFMAVPIWRSRKRRWDEPPVPSAGDVAQPRIDVPASEADGPIAVGDPELVTEAEADHRVRTRMIWIGGIIVPAIILIVLLAYSSAVGRATAHVPEDEDLVIDVIGHAFWWEVQYPDLDITTANEIHVPVDQRVQLRLTTADIIHSFWMPRLHGKVDMIPGRENVMTFTAEEVGSFRGQCAEFCGIAHAQMVAFVEAMEPADFDAWVDQQQQPAGEAASVEGEQVFLDIGCAACHAVDGTDAVAQVGPDLTHLASRNTLAAGIVPNTRENLAHLIIDPWDLKPGIPMPPTELEEDELDALLDYLEGLE
jgi:cytochrome c oxidase subunit II